MSISSILNHTALQPTASISPSETIINRVVESATKLDSSAVCRDEELEDWIRTSRFVPICMSRAAVAMLLRLSGDGLLDFYTVSHWPEVQLVYQVGMGRDFVKSKKKLTAEPEVLIANLTSRGWPNRAEPYSVSTLTQSTRLVVCRVSPGVPKAIDDSSKGYGVFYMGKEGVDKDQLLYESPVKGAYSKELIPLVQTGDTT